MKKLFAGAVFLTAAGTAVAEEIAFDKLTGYATDPYARFHLVDNAGKHKNLPDPYNYTNRADLQIWCGHLLQKGPYFAVNEIAQSFLDGYSKKTILALRPSIEKAARDGYEACVPKVM